MHPSFLIRACDSIMAIWRGARGRAEGQRLDVERSMIPPREEEGFPRNTRVTKVLLGGLAGRRELGVRSTSEHADYIY